MNRLYRSTDNRIIGGVAAGLANYFNVDPVLIRLLWVFSVFIDGAGFFAYIIAWIIIPEAPAGTQNNETKSPPAVAETDGPKPAKTGDKIRNAGLLLIGLGFIFLAGQFIPHALYRFSWPVFLILVGFFFLLRGWKEE